MNGKTIGAIVVIIIVIIFGWWLLATRPATTTTETATPSGSTDNTAGGPSTGTSINPHSQDTTVTYTDQGFTPKDVTIPQGATVTFVNQSSDEMWVASAPHPAHTGYDGTSRATHCAANYTGPAPFDECTSVTKGGSYAFTFDKVGTWPYHNHGAAQDFGTITVTALVQNGGIGPQASTSTP